MPQITTIVLGILTTAAGGYLLYYKTTSNFLGYATVSTGIYTSVIGMGKLYANMHLTLHQKKPQCAVDHWLYKVIPRNWESITWYKPWEYFTWGLFGNDDDGIFGEEASSGTKWLTQWGSEKDEQGTLKKAGEISFKRFLMWNLRNPLHNFTFYVVGFAAWQNIPLKCIALLSTQSSEFLKPLKEKDIFPMAQSSGLYLGLHILPVASWRINITANKRIEGYIGYRTRGNFGLCLRLKKRECT